MSTNNENKINNNEESQGELSSKEKASMTTQVKELIQKLIKNSLNNSLTKLESNSENKESTLKSIGKTSIDYLTKITKLIQEVDENTNKKKLKIEKPKIKKKESLKNIKKLVITQSNFEPRNERFSLENKTKKINKNKVEDIYNKTTTRFNTLNITKIINEKPKINKLQNIANKT